LPVHLAVCCPRRVILKSQRNPDRSGLGWRASAGKHRQRPDRCYPGGAKETGREIVTFKVSGDLTHSLPLISAGRRELPRYNVKSHAQLARRGGRTLSAVRCDPFLALPLVDGNATLSRCELSLQRTTLCEATNTQLIRIQNGAVHISKGATNVYATDKDRELERWLLNTGTPHLKSEIFQIAERDLR